MNGCQESADMVTTKDALDMKLEELAEEKSLA